MALKRLKKYLRGILIYHRERKQVSIALAEKKEVLMARIVRFVHSIEKGLSIESPRPEFGYDKIKKMYSWINEYLDLEDIDKTCIYMAADALADYLKYHETIGVDTEKIYEIRTIASRLKEIKEEDGVEGVFGGVQTIEKSQMLFDISKIEQFFTTRHSIRQFKKESVPNELIEKAIDLAQTAPSACNRQAVRAYCVEAQRFIDLYPAKLEGVGGFIESSDKIVLITGKISSYEYSEHKQFVVSAGIFVGYLTLALHGIGVGTCVVQRSLVPDNTWHEFCSKTGIPSDEQAVCLLAVGQLDEKIVVPVSKRFDIKKIFKWL